MKKAALITREGWHKLDDELKYLWKTRRPEVTQAVSEAAALGDRSENAEYKEGKRLLRSIDRRVRFLTKRLDELQIVDHAPIQNGTVYFGAYVELERAEYIEEDAPESFLIELEERANSKEPPTTRLENEDIKISDLVRYRIVGSDELDPNGFQISIDAPMARALIGKKVDDEVYVNTPRGPQCWYINKIQYQPFDTE